MQGISRANACTKPYATQGTYSMCCPAHTLTGSVDLCIDGRQCLHVTTVSGFVGLLKLSRQLGLLKLELPKLGFLS